MVDKTILFSDFVFPKMTLVESISEADTSYLQSMISNTKVEIIEKPNLTTQVEDPTTITKSTETNKAEDLQQSPADYLIKHRPNNTLNRSNPSQESPAVISHSDEETKITYYASGNKWLELNYQNTQQHGKQFGWYENGNPMYELNYLSGKKNGKQIWWDKSGKVTTEKIYRNGEWLREADL